MCAKWRPSQLPLMVSGPPLVIRPDQGHLSIFQRRETTYVSPQSEAQRPVFPPSRARKSDRFYRQPPTYALTPLCLLGFPGCRCALAGSITLMRVDPDAGSPTILLRPALAHLAYRHRFSPASHSARPAWTSLRLHAAVTKRLRKALAPDLKVRLSGIEPRSIRTQRSHRQMHVRMTALVMQGEHIRKPRPERLRCKGSRRIVQPHRICALGILSTIERERGRSRRPRGSSIASTAQSDASTLIAARPSNRSPSGPSRFRLPLRLV